MSPEFDRRAFRDLSYGLYIVTKVRQLGLRLEWVNFSGVGGHGPIRRRRCLSRSQEKVGIKVT